MPNLSIKDVPEAWAQALRQRAARNHRSLQGELMALIQGVIEPQSISTQTNTPLTADALSQAQSRAELPAAGQGKVVGLDRFGNPIRRQGWKTVEQIAAELRANPQDAKLCRELPRGVDIIREERDAR